MQCWRGSAKIDVLLSATPAVLDYEKDLLIIARFLIADFSLESDYGIK